MTAHGNGGETLVVLLPAAIWREVLSIGDGGTDRCAGLGAYAKQIITSSSRASV